MAANNGDSTAGQTPMGRRWLAATLLVAGAAAEGVAPFLQWYHYYPPGGRPWPMTDLADAQPFFPWRFLTSNPTSNPSTRIWLVALLVWGPTFLALLYAGLIVVRRGRRTRGLWLVACVSGFWAFLLDIAFGFHWTDSNWRVSMDIGSQLSAIGILALFGAGGILFFARPRPLADGGQGG